MLGRRGSHTQSKTSTSAPRSVNLFGQFLNHEPLFLSLVGASGGHRNAAPTPHEDVHGVLLLQVCAWPRLSGEYYGALRDGEILRRFEGLWMAYGFIYPRAPGLPPFRSWLGWVQV